MAVPENLTAFVDGPDWLKNAVAKAEKEFKGILPPETGKSTAYYSPSLKRVHMGRHYTAGSDEFMSTWRHEFGHHVDECMGKQTGMRVWKKGSALHFDLKKERASVVKRTAAALKNPPKDLEAEAKRLGFPNRAALRSLLDSFKVGGTDLTVDHATDQILRGDLYGFMDSFPRSYKASKEWTMFADTVCALHKGDKAWGHTKAYFSRKGNPETEIFAQFTSLLCGKNRKTWEPLLKHCYPDTFAKFTEIVTNYGAT